MPNYRTRYNKTPAEKYSPHITAQNWSCSNVGMTTQTQIVVPPSDDEGARKVKHITIDGTASNMGDNMTPNYGSFGFVIMYLPNAADADQVAAAINWQVAGTPGELFPSPGWVMAAGTFTATTGKFRLTSPLARILNKGDAIMLYVTNF